MSGGKQPCGWIAPTGQLFPLSAYRPEQRLAYDAHKAGWRHVFADGDTPDMDLAQAQVAEFAAQSACRHLSSLVDFERQVSERCMAAMKALMEAAEPVNNEFQDCHIDYADYAKFVDAHAELLYVIKNGERPAAPVTLTPAMRADAAAIGACCDPMSLEVGDPA